MCCPEWAIVLIISGILTSASDADSSFIALKANLPSLLVEIHQHHFAFDLSMFYTHQ